MQPPLSSLGMDFGRGLAASAAAAGGGVPPVAPVPQAPMTPLAAPIESAPTYGGGRGRPGFSADASASARRRQHLRRACRQAVWRRMGQCCRRGGRLMPTGGGFDAGASVDP